MKTMPNELASFAMSKRTVGLLGIALCLAAWGYKAEAAMGLGLAGIAIGGTIMRFLLNRPTRVSATSPPPPGATGVDLIKEWLTREHRLTWCHRALLWCVALPLIVWWPTRFQLMMGVGSTLLVAVIGITGGCGKGKETPAGIRAAPAADQRTTDASPAGHWEGDITGDGPLRMRVTLDLAKNAKSEWIATMGVPSANKTDLLVKPVAVNGKSVKFVAAELMRAAFDLTLGPDGSMKGTISGPGSQPVEFKRAGGAKVELPEASPAVSKDLEGDWEGSLKTPSGPARMAFHFKSQQPDQTVTATFDSGNAVGLPLKNVKQTG